MKEILKVLFIIMMILAAAFFIIIILPFALLLGLFLSLFGYKRPRTFTAFKTSGNFGTTTARPRDYSVLGSDSEGNTVIDVKAVEVNDKISGDKQ